MEKHIFQLFTDGVLYGEKMNYTKMRNANLYN